MRAHTIVARAPTRIDLGGGWTDVPPYCDREGGFVCNVAINRHAVATLSAGESPAGAPLRSPDAAQPGDDALIDAALRRSGATDVRIALSNDFPLGAGLGGSSAASAAVLGVLATWRGESWDRRAIAEEGRRMEVEEMGVAGGRQDHYAATLGGALALRFGSSVDARHLVLSESTRMNFERRSVLIYTHQSHNSGDTVTAVLDAYRNRERRVLVALERMKQLAEEMSFALEAGDIDHLGALVGEHWRHQRSLNPAIPTPRIDEIIARVTASGAVGAKAMGASGGGCVFVVAAAENVEQVRKAVASLGTLLPFAIDTSGLTACA